MFSVGFEPTSPSWATGFKPVVFANFTTRTDGLPGTRTQNLPVKSRLLYAIELATLMGAPGIEPDPLDFQSSARTT